jgi:hypothetical protein
VPLIRYQARVRLTLILRPLGRTKGFVGVDGPIVKRLSDDRISSEVNLEAIQSRSAQSVRLIVEIVNSQ